MKLSDFRLFGLIWLQIHKKTRTAKAKFWQFRSAKRAHVWVLHYSQKADLLNRQYQSQFTKERLTDLQQEQESQFPSMPDITVYNEGVVKLLQQLSPFKAAGPDGITPYVLKTAAEELAPALTIIFQKPLDTGIVPLDWLCANITPIFKKGDRTSPANYRSVNLTSVCSKILEHILHTNIMRHLDSHKILCQQQHGFRKNHSCETQLISTVQDIAQNLDNKYQTDVIIMDFTKAFDKVPHQRLLLKLWRYGIRNKTHAWIKSFLTNRKQRVIVDGENSPWVDVESSVPQGTVTGPLDFLLFINDLPESLSCNVRLFADDCILYTNISSDEDAARLQEDLDRLTQWQNTWQMMFNPDKCYVLRVTHSRSPQVFAYKLNNTVLKEADSHTYLGVDISSDLTWNSHINRITSKANKSLGFLRWNLYSCSKQIKEMAYKSLVRPILEYSSPVWDPHMKTLAKQLEAVQNRAARFVSGVYSRKSSITSIKQELKWTDLETRRKVARLIIFHQSLAGQLAIPVRNFLRPVQRTSRNTNPEYNFTPIAANKNCYKNSFLPHTLIDWNNLPQSITTIKDKDAFKSAINHHFNIN